MDENLPELVQLKQRGSVVEQRNFIFGVARQVVERCGLVDQAILGDKVADSGDKVHNYALVFAHYASLALEFYDALGRRGRRTYHKVLESPSTTFLYSTPYKILPRSIVNAVSDVHSYSSASSPVTVESFCEYPWWQRM